MGSCGSGSGDGSGSGSGVGSLGGSGVGSLGGSGVGSLGGSGVGSLGGSGVGSLGGSCIGRKMSVTSRVLCTMIPLSNPACSQPVATHLSWLHEFGIRTELMRL